MARRRRTRYRASDSGVMLAIVALLAVGFAIQIVQEHPVAAASVAVTVIALAVTIGWLWLRWSRNLAQRERAVAVTDIMSGTEFEHWVARLMRASGCRRVRVSGRAGDMGADLTGYAPDGRRLVVQCKRYSAKVGSEDVQRFAGTARHIHQADVPLLVTNNYFTAPATVVARKCHITVVDRDTLASWLASLALPIPAASSTAAWSGSSRLVQRWRLRRRPGPATPPTSAAPRVPTAGQPVSHPPASASPRPSTGTDWWNETP